MDKYCKGCAIRDDHVGSLTSLVEALWDIIDDIDTATDFAKGSDKKYRVIVEWLQKKRWQLGITTDGHTLDLRAGKIPDDYERGITYAKCFGEG